MKHILHICLILLAMNHLCCAQIPTVTAGQLLFGDLLFVVTPKGNAITEVTNGIEGLPMDHVAAFIPATETDATAYIMEAAPELGVAKRNLVAFTEQARDSYGEAHILAMRVLGQWDKNRLAEVFSQLEGRSYDYLFDPNDEAFYCSELIQKGYFDMAGMPIFETIPMEFRDKDGKIPQHWIDLYAEKSLEVPEGTPGTNPGQLSRSPRLEIIGWLK